MIRLSREPFTSARRNKCYSAARCVTNSTLFFYVSLFALLFVIQIASAQVTNNSIAERYMLQADAEPLFSTTDQSTVEWACVNKKLTERCLIYHNDQWFTFSPDRDGTFFLNVSEQTCKKKFGVQVVVIEGNPCETSTYRLLHCESFTNQSDTFIQLDGLRADKQYLINIDGFLADICGFKIQVGHKPAGLPQKSEVLNSLHLTSTINKDVVSLHWEVNENLLDSLYSFEIYRQGMSAYKKEKIRQVPLGLNSIGHALTAYQYTDTVTKHDTYVYTILGVFNDGKKRVVLEETRIRFASPKQYQEEKHHVASIPLQHKKKGDIDFLIMNDASGEVLFKRTCTACSSQVIDLDLTREVNKGIARFRIETLHLKTREQQFYIFYLDASGTLRRK